MEIQNNDNNNEEWEVTLTFNIDTLRALNYHLDYAILMWPGAPARPTEEQEFLRQLKYSIYGAIMDHNFHTMDSE